MSETDKSASKKRRKKDVSTNGSSIEGDGYKKLSLSDIRDRIAELCHLVPLVPEGGIDPNDTKAVQSWASKMQAVLEEFNLLVCCISGATYVWGTERSGSGHQQLDLLTAELQLTRDQISTSVSTRLSNVLAPDADLVIEKVRITKDEATKCEVRENVFTRKQTDPDFIKLCSFILCRNARMLRQVLLCNFHKIHQCIGDYLKNADNSSASSRGFAC